VGGLVNIGSGTPFVSTLELRQLGAEFYPPVTPGRIMSLYARQNMRTGLDDDDITRYVRVVYVSSLTFDVGMHPSFNSVAFKLRSSYVM
jgi:hypothetical protein